MELRVLKYFLAVANEQNITTAAQKLHLSQPTLSVQLKDLEKELGKQLLIRGSHGSRKVTLTEEGMILRKRAESILDLVEKTEKEISSSQDAIAGDIYIGAGETDSIRYFARAAKRLAAESPLIRYHFTSGNAAYVMERLDQGFIDFGLVFGPVDLKRYNKIPLFPKEQWGVLMPETSPLAEKSRITPDDLKNEPLIISHQKDSQTAINGWLGEDLSKLNIVATYNLILNAAILTEEGFGYTLCFNHLIDVIHHPRLCFRPLYPTLETEGCIIWRKYEILPKAATRFLTELQKELASHQP
jgi:DNA-binding transcriptional LysR family regulator